MSVFGRILLVFGAYLLACIAASAVLTAGTLLPGFEEYQSPALSPAMVWSIVTAGGAVVIASIAFLPALLLIAFGETFAWRSSLIYAVLGGALALALRYGLDFAGYAGVSGGGLAREREVLAASGIAGGFVYWLFAGRSAGVWKQ
jgi:hypothetical protein